MLSIIIPSYKDPYLVKTIDSIISSAKGEIEIIAVLDGYIPNEKINPDPRVKVIKFKKNRGMRASINAGIRKAKGKFIMKSDSHCAFAPGFDLVLTKCCRPNWLVIPRRYSLDEINWTKDESRPVKDYHYLTFPLYARGYGYTMSCQDWNYRIKEKNNPKYEIDDTMMFQGSCWLANKAYFIKKVGHLDGRAKTYGQFGGEQMEIGLKYWLGGGKVKVVKKTWYAHLSKQKRHYDAGIYTRSYKVNSKTAISRLWMAKHWMNNREPKMIHKISWLVKKFSPVPTWPDDEKLWVFK